MFTHLLREVARDFCTLSPEQAARLEDHYRLILHWNQRLNLTSVTKLEDAVIRHYGESLFLSTHLPEEVRVIDAGSGAGFPGIPCAVMHPNSSFDLVESNRRKAVFLKEATRDLANVRVLDRRVEDLDARYNWLIGRALKPQMLLRLPIFDHAALLVGAEAANSHPESQTILLPWGRGRFLLLH